MAEEKISLHVDDDWKKQAQEEKRRLVEEEQKRKATVAGPAGVVASAAAPAAPAAAGSAAAGGSAKAPAATREGELPTASMETLVQSIVTQVLYYLGDLAARGGEPVVNLDMAKHHIDTLGMIEEKTRGNLTDQEKRALDAALYEVRMRYISVASRYAELP